MSYGRVHVPYKFVNRVCRLSVLLLIILITLSGCAPGKNGEDAIAFLRNGYIWRIQPDGSSLVQLTGPRILGFAWSPDHHRFVARFASSSVSQAVHTPILNSTGDVVSGLGTFSIDGGNVIPIAALDGNPNRSDAWWNSQGNRIFYRENADDDRANWYLSQDDQPNSIARKLIATSIIVPTSSPNSQHIATVTNQGELVEGAPQETTDVIATHIPLVLSSGWPIRPLWRPNSDQILYPVPGPEPDSSTLMLVSLSKTSKPVGTFRGVQQYCWSPDGKYILVRTGNNYHLYSPANESDIVWDDEEYSLPWWSPDSQWILTRSEHILKLIEVNTGNVQTLATFATSSQSIPSLSDLTRLHPITTSPWHNDSHRFVFSSSEATWYTGKSLATQKTEGSGLYIVQIAQRDQLPSLIDWGEHTLVSWSTPDPNTQFVAP
jgi:hypothetical protein